jgi:hypothetical protein
MAGSGSYRISVNGAFPPSFISFFTGLYSVKVESIAVTRFYQPAFNLLVDVFMELLVILVVDAFPSSQQKLVGLLCSLAENIGFAGNILCIYPFHFGGRKGKGSQGEHQR